MSKQHEKAVEKAVDDAAEEEKESAEDFDGDDVADEQLNDTAAPRRRRPSTQYRRGGRALPCTTAALTARARTGPRSLHGTSASA